MNPELSAMLFAFHSYQVALRITFTNNRSFRNKNKYYYALCFMSFICSEFRGWVRMYVSYWWYGFRKIVQHRDKNSVLANVGLWLKKSQVELSFKHSINDVQTARSLFGLMMCVRRLWWWLNVEIFIFHEFASERSLSAPKCTIFIPLKFSVFSSFHEWTRI